MKRAMKAAAFTQGNVYWRVPYVGERLKVMTCDTQIAVS